LVVDKETKQLSCNLILPCKLLWDFNKKEECNFIIQNWQITFQALNYKENNFLDLLDIDYLPTKPTYTKNGI